MQGNYQKVTDAYLDRLFQVVSQKPRDWAMALRPGVNKSWLTIWNRKPALS
jgi:hypothetical protein